LKINGSYALPVPSERAYTLLQDPEILQKCMPGIDSLTKIGQDEYEMNMKLSIASMGGLFTGKVRITDQQPPTSFRIVVEGSGKIGFMKGDGLMKLEPNGPATAVNYEGDVQVGGTIAAVGQRLIDSTSRMLIKKFFDKLAAISS
jgi:carbon monoxide dehydrogenase subunit G